MWYDCIKSEAGGFVGAVKIMCFNAGETLKKNYIFINDLLISCPRFTNTQLRMAEWLVNDEFKQNI